MIGEHEKHIKKHKRLRLVVLGFTLILAVAAAMTEVEPSKFPQYPLLVPLHYYSLCAVPFLLVGVGVGEKLEKRSGPPEIWAVIHLILTDMHNSIFPPDCNKAEHRVTLFKLSKIWRGSFLIPIERSHHMGRKSRARFQVYDDGGQQRQEQGVAGETFARRSCVYVDHLPDVCPVLGPEPAISLLQRIKGLFLKKPLTDADNVIVDSYAQKSWTARSMVKKNMLARKSMPRSLCGLPVEVKGEVWGVVVVDSRSETLIEQQKIDAFYKKHAAVMSMLIQYTL